MSRSRQPSHSSPRRVRARSRQQAEPRGHGWVALVGIVAVLLGAVVAYRDITRTPVLTSNTTNATLFGATASNGAALSRATSQFGRMPIIRVYYNGLPDPHVWTTGSPGINHSAAIISFRSPPDVVLSGADDAALSRFFDTAPTSRTTYYTYYHEPETLVQEHAFTVSSYRAAWAHIVALADKAHNPNLKSTLILMSWDLNPRSGINWKDYLPAAGSSALSAGTPTRPEPCPTITRS